MGYEHTNSKGVKYYLNSKGRLYFFSKDKRETSCELPAGYKIIEHPTTKMPMLKKE